MKKRYSQFVLLGFSLITLFFMMACGGGSSEESASSNTPDSTSEELKTTTVEISIQIPDFSTARQLAASSEDVVRVTVDVTNEIGNVYVAAQELEAQGGYWVGQLENVPVGLNLVLKIHAYDVNGIEIYSAETSDVFSETPQPVSLEVAPVPKAIASVRLQLPSSSSTARTLALATLDDIASVSLEILDGATPVVPTVTLAESNNTWSTDPPVGELPVGVLLTFRATAVDAGSTEIFKGETTTYLHSEANNILIFMSLAADTDGTLLTFPRITQIQLPQEFAPATTGTVSITVEGNSNEELIYELAASGGGSFSLGTTPFSATISGTINVGGTGETQLDTTYFAPATTNNYNNTVTMTNELGNSITWDFVTQVANPTGNISLIFNPIITGLNVSQIATSGTALYFVATLSEDPNQNNTGLIYSWSFADTSATISASASGINNTFTLGNYNPNTIAGTLTLIVSDPILVEGQQRQTTLRYNIPLQLFPENTIDYVSILDSKESNDVNGDGYPDLAVGALFYDNRNGRAYIFYGSSSGISSMSASAADSILSGVGNDFGFSVALGDVNGDGYADLAVGAYEGTGAAYIFHGSASGIASTIASAADTILTGNGGYFTNGLAFGDVNGDGYDDLAVGAHHSATVYLFYGSSSGIASKNASAADSTFTGESEFGFRTAFGDVNKDGYADLAVVNLYTKAYIFHGSASGIASKDGSAADTIISGSLGNMVKFGDVNGDGNVDLAVGAHQQNKAYIFHGSSSGISSQNTSSADTVLIGESGNYFGGSGFSSANFGDVNNDGYDDLGVGAGFYNNNQGRVYLFYGSVSGIASKNASAADSTFTGEATGNFFGSEPPAFLDMNGDGYQDLAAAAEYYSGETGRVYIFPGSSSGISSKIASSADTILTGEGGRFGRSMSY